MALNFKNDDALDSGLFSYLTETGEKLQDFFMIFAHNL